MSGTRRVLLGAGIGAGVGLIMELVMFRIPISDIPGWLETCLNVILWPAGFCAQLVTCIKVNMASNEAHALPWNCIPSIPVLVIFIFLEWVLIGVVCGLLAFPGAKEH